MTSEQNKVSLPLLFLIVGIASFITGSLFGLLILQKEDPSFENTDLIEPPSIESQSSDETPDLSLQDIPENQEESVVRYRNMLKKTLEDETNPPENIEYGIYLNRFTQNERANDFAIEMKSRYPIWDVTVYEQNNSFIVFIGPFESQEEAQDFIKGLPQIPELKPARVIQISI